jgi:CDP-2,3-bis-(O-geranylgeranyl)-sn-glycerol synthase
MFWEIAAQAFWIILPAYIANASAVLVGGGKPIDFGRKYKDGKRILGDGKTWKGLIIGGLIGIIVGFVMLKSAYILNPIILEKTHATLALTDFGGFPVMIPIIASIAYGALFGDIIESFFKRRRNIKRGQDWIPFDQLDFILGVLFFSFLMSALLDLLNLTEGNWFFDTLKLEHIVFLLVVTPFLHFLSNYLHRTMKTYNSSK